MKTADLNTNLIDSYYTLLKSLSPNNKLELIARLSKSMKTTKKVKDNSWKSLFGAWELDQSADDFVEELKRDRKFTRKAKHVNLVGIVLMVVFLVLVNKPYYYQIYGNLV